MSQWTTRGNLLFSNEVIGFDKLSSSYVVFRNGSLNKFGDDNTAESFFNPSDMGKTVLDGAAVATDTPQDDYVVFLKSNTGNTIYVQKFLFWGWQSPKDSIPEEKRCFQSPKLSMKRQNLLFAKIVRMFISLPAIPFMCITTKIIR